ncbi:MAG: hypothetical protein QXM51_05495, partial [Thermoproteota archaeon]
MQNENVEQIPEEVISELTNKITIVLKDGRIKLLPELSIEDFGGIYEKWEYGGALDPIGQLSAWLLNQIYSLLQGVKSSLEYVINSAISEVKNTLNSISGGISSLSSAISSVITQLANIISSNVGNLTSTILSMSSSLSSAIGSLGSTISNIAQSISNSISSLASSLSASISSAIYSLSSAISGIANTMSNLFQNVINTITQSMSNISNIILNLSSSISTAISGIANTMSNLFQNVISTLTQSFTNIANTISNLSNIIVSSLQGITNTISSLFQNVITTITQTINGITNTISNIMSNISITISEIVNTLNSLIANLINTITSQFRNLIDAISTIPSTISNILSGITTTITAVIQNLIGEFTQAFKNITGILSNIINIIREIAKEVGKAISDLYNNSIKPTLEDILHGKLILHLPDNRKISLGDLLSDIRTVLDRQAVAFMGFVNPLNEISSWLNKQFKNIGKWIWEGIDTVFDGATTFIKKFVEWISKIFDKMSQSIEYFVRWISEMLQLPHTDRPIFQRMSKSLYEEWAEKWLGIIALPLFHWENINKLIMWAWDYIVNSIKWMVTKLPILIGDIINAINPAIEKIFSVFTESILVKSWKVDLITIPAISLMFSRLIAEQQLTYNNWIMESAILFKAIWDVQIHLLLKTPIRDLILSAFALSVIANVTGLLGQIELALTPILAKVGAKIDPKAIKAEIKDLAKEGLKEWAKTMIFTFSFWVFEPVKYIMNPLFRGWLPIEVPTLHEIIEISRRYLPDNEYTCGQISPSKIGSVYKDIEMYLYDTIAKRGYPLWFDSLITKGYGGYNTIIRDRFNTPRVIPSALLFSLPAPSDCVRMMLRDMIQNLDDFGKIMLMHGFHPDVSALYFMLHFRYPSTEKLFEFACRVASGIVWVDSSEPALSNYFNYINKEKANFMKWGLGFEPTTPKFLADTLDRKYPLTDLTRVEEIARKRISEAFAPLGVYFKWHDLFPMAWIEGQTSDQMIAMELSADIPMRIDGRWMYKWGVIDDREVVRIVMARGMHPKWVEKIAIAEMMNAMAEERTIVRTGIMNSFKEGFFKEDKLMYQLSNLTTIRLLDREVPVKFLEGEVKLMTLRAKYDRALDILLNAQKSMFMAYAENMVDYEDVKNVLRNLTSVVANQLKIPLIFDEEYYDTYRQGLDVRKVYETVSRIRRWLRYAILEVMSRVKSGYLSDSEIKSALEMIRHHAKLTDEDVAYFYDLAKLMRSQFDRQVVIQAILKKLSKGEISKDTAMELMIKAGLEESVAESLIELHAKTYSISIAQYISYANYLDIPTEYLERKLDILGVPEDEKKLILAVFEIKPIA